MDNIEEVKKILRVNKVSVVASKNDTWLCEESVESLAQQLIKLPEGEPPLLSDRDWETINQKAGVDVLDIVVNLDNRYTKPQQADLIAKRCNLTAKAQRDSDIKWIRNETT